MGRSVFWSWQSDQPARETRNLIQEALKSAISELAAEMEGADRPEIDHDTRGVPGTPDITATILAKIERASVFVADVTPIAVTSGGKHVANPNVLIELGYAKKALGLDRIIMVWNTSLTNARPEDLPFDMRHRRAPFAIILAEGASPAELKSARSKLSNQLKEALSAIMKSILSQPQPQPDLPWHLHDENSSSIWPSEGEALVVNLPSDGSVRMAMDGLPRAFARILP
jgi:hypothetical protein